MRYSDSYSIADVARSRQLVAVASGSSLSRALESAARVGDTRVSDLSPSLAP
jgi:hypothetical protein